MKALANKFFSVVQSNYFTVVKYRGYINIIVHVSSYIIINYNYVTANMNYKYPCI